MVFTNTPETVETFHFSPVEPVDKLGFRCTLSISLSGKGGGMLQKSALTVLRRKLREIGITALFGQIAI